MNINEIPFGNPERSNLKYLHSDNYLDSLLPELKSYPFPENDSEQAATEIQQIINANTKLYSDEPLLKRFEVYDTLFEQHMVESLVVNGVPKEKVQALIDSVKEDTKPLLLKLKFHYQRIRPIQLSKIIGKELNPYNSLSANTPSYPSGHVFQSRIYAEVLGNTYPEFYKSLQELATDIMWSRIYMGLHYVSDCEFADYVAQVVCNHPDFKKKYRL
jgi:hypothetical protein